MKFIADDNMSCLEMIEGEKTSSGIRIDNTPYLYREADAIIVNYYAFNNVIINNEYDQKAYDLLKEKAQHLGIEYLAYNRNGSGFTDLRDYFVRKNSSLFDFGKKNVMLRNTFSNVWDQLKKELFQVERVGIFSDEEESFFFNSLMRLGEDDFLKIVELSPLINDYSKLVKFYNSNESQDDNELCSKISEIRNDLEMKINEAINAADRQKREDADMKRIQTKQQYEAEKNKLLNNLNVKELDSYGDQFNVDSNNQSWLTMDDYLKEKQ